MATKLTWRQIYTKELKQYAYNQLIVWKSLADFYESIHADFGDEFITDENEVKETAALYATALQDLYTGVPWEEVAKTLGVKPVLLFYGKLVHFTIDTAA